MLTLFRRILALLAPAALLTMLTDTAAAALLAPVALPIVVTDSAASALLALAALPTVWARLGWHDEEHNKYHRCTPKTSGESGVS